jgi:hypothetical protein
MSTHKRSRDRLARKIKHRFQLRPSEGRQRKRATSEQLDAVGIPVTKDVKDVTDHVTRKKQKYQLDPSLVRVRVDC